MEYIYTYLPKYVCQDILEFSIICMHNLYKHENVFQG